MMFCYKLCSKWYKVVIAQYPKNHFIPTQGKNLRASGSAILFYQALHVEPHSAPVTNQHSFWLRKSQCNYTSRISCLWECCWLFYRKKNLGAALTKPKILLWCLHIRSRRSYKKTNSSNLCKIFRMRGPPNVWGVRFSRVGTKFY